MISDSLDTNVLLRYILNDVPGQADIVSHFLKTSPSVHYVEDLTICEAVYVMQSQYSISRQSAVDRLNFFFARFADTVEYNRNLTAIVFPMFLSHPKLSFNDCCLAAYAELRHREPLFTFDKKLARQMENAKLLG